MRRRALLRLLPLAALAPAARMTRSSNTGAAPTYRVVLPGLAASNPPPAARSFRMGFFPVPPGPSVASLLQTFPVAARHSDAIWIQREVPWSRILAGTPMATVLDEDWDGFVGFFRGLGLRLSILVDPLYGLDRTRESEETRRAGRSLNEPELRALHEQWVELVARRYRPDYFGLASEINSLAARGDPVLFANIRDMCNRLAPRVRAAAPGTKVLVSFQVDEAWGRPPIPPSPIDQFALTREFDIDVLGLSSYPSFFFPGPADIPVDYFRRLQVASGKPVLVAEGGWSTDPLGTGETGAWLARQRDYYARLFELLDSVDAELVISLLFADMDLAAYAAASPQIDAAGLKPFSRMGLLHADMSPKPALEVWDEHFALPYAG